VACVERSIRLAFTAPWLIMEVADGPSGVERVYREVLAGETSPDKAQILSIAGR